MFFDSLTMACIAGELRAEVLGGRVQQALLPDPLSIGLEIYAGQRRHYVLASAHTEAGRVVLSSDKLRRGVEKEAGILVLLRKYVRGAALVAIAQPPFERILHLGFEHPEWGATTLAVEVMGRHSNVILVGPGDRVLDSVKRVGPQLSPARLILPGHAYTPPPPQEKLPPSELTEYRLQQMLADQPPTAQVAQILVAGLKGVSPLLAREVAFRALGHPRATAGEVARLSPLREALAELLAPLDSGDWQPTLCLEDGQPVAYAPYRITYRGESRPVPSMSAAVEDYTAAVASADPYAAAKRPIRQAIAEARTRLEHRRDALAHSLAQAEEAEHLRERGEWILAYAHTIEPGQRELLADTGGRLLRIPLDPDLSPSENAQACFSAYRKAQRANEGVPALLEEANLGLSDLAQLETDLDLAASRPDVEAVRAALAEAGHLRPGKSRAPGAASGGPLSLLSPDGLPILVGRNSRQNDEVTFRRAQGDDWWFHVHGVPGAHVIVRGGSAQQELPLATIRRAAALAARFSAARNEAEVLVDYTRRRYVRRIPHAAPGLVTYSQEQTIRVAPRGPEDGDE